jgi:hypothetical protein
MSIVLTGRNDDYGGGFRQRLFRAASHNARLFDRAGVTAEFVLVEWNPRPGAPLLACEFVARLPRARAFVVAPQVHEAYSLNPFMAFHEMPAKNAGIRRAAGEWIVATNADVLFDDDLVARLAWEDRAPGTLYRARRIDVSPDVPWARRRDPAAHWPSGEGARTPAYYTGGGGDFCCASRDLWQRLRGFNERVRFSTRAKDWQFFLTAAALDVPIEFIGEVYHLSHASGYQHGTRADREAPAVSFGRAWDIDFGVPVVNGPAWGLAALRERPDPTSPAIVHLEPDGALFSAGEDEVGRSLRDALEVPADGSDPIAGDLLHACWRAAVRRGRLITTLRSARARVTLAGLARVLRAHGVAVSDTEPPLAFDGFRNERLDPAPGTPGPGDMRLTDEDGRVTVTDVGTGRRLAFRPTRRPPRRPRPEPILPPRLLHAWLRIHRAGGRRVAVFGAGGHTEAMLDWGVPDVFEVVALVASAPGAATALGLPLVSLEGLPLETIDAVLLSSVSYEPEMHEAAIRRGVPLVVPLYEDWPPRA